jgi:hypothetical protein
MSSFVVPVGPNSATVKVLDANGADITAGCTISAESSDSAAIAIGNPDAASPNVIPFTALEEGASATITYQAVNSVGQVTQTDTLQVQVSGPASMQVTYGTTLPVAPSNLPTLPGAAKPKDKPKA